MRVRVQRPKPRPSERAVVSSVDRDKLVLVNKRTQLPRLDGRFARTISRSRRTRSTWINTCVFPFFIYFVCAVGPHLVDQDGLYRGKFEDPASATGCVGDVVSRS